MSFLSQIQRFDKKALAHTTTVVTTAGGTQYTEETTDCGVNATSGPTLTTGFVMSADARTEEGGGEVGSSVEVSFHTHLAPPTKEELAARLLWQKERLKLGDGFSVTPKDVLLRCGVFVLSKSENEEHYDGFAFLLANKCFVTQLDHSDIVSGALDNLDVVIFPGGLIFDVEKALGKDGAEVVSKFVHGGGGYFGVCAGAFLAAADGYNGNDPSKKIIAAEASWIDGVGSMQVKTTKKAAEVIGEEFANKTIDLFWANGAILKPISTAKNHILNYSIPDCEVLGTTVSITLEGKEKSLEGIQHNAAILSGNFGAGRVVIFGPHPEASGMRFKACISNAVLWCGKKR